jgi:hypothetical protein
MQRFVYTLPLAVLLALFASTLSPAQVTFTQTAINSGDTSSTGIVSGDFNNDGILDLVTLNGSSLSFYRGLGAGTYASPVTQSMPSGLGQVLTADFNQDGKLDLAIATACCTSSGGVTIMLGNGDGTFTQGTDINVGSNSVAYIALADFNGDHKPDIALSVQNSSGGGYTQVYLGQGNGTFKLSATTSHGGYNIVAGDFNADGHQDIAVVDANDNTVDLYLGKGNGAFNVALAVNIPVSSIAVGDFYNDRIQSLAVYASVYQPPNFANTLYTVRYLNGQWVAKEVYNQPNGEPYFYMTAGDLNGDFKDDIFIAGGDVDTSSISAYALGNGDGTFQAFESAPAYADLENFLFIRDLSLDSRHDVGIAYTGIFEPISGAEILLNVNATTNCDPPKPNALSVRICAPTSGQTVGKTFTFKGAGNAFNGIAKRMELWIDGKKVGENLEDQLNVTTTLTRGSHTASFVAVDSFDNYVSKSVSFTASY